MSPAEQAALVQILRAAQPPKLGMKTAGGVAPEWLGRIYDEQPRQLGLAEWIRTAAGGDEWRAKKAAGMSRRNPVITDGGMIDEHGNDIPTDFHTQMRLQFPALFNQLDKEAPSGPIPVAKTGFKGTI